MSSVVSTVALIPLEETSISAPATSVAPSSVEETPAHPSSSPVHRSSTGLVHILSPLMEMEEQPLIRESKEEDSLMKSEANKDLLIHVEVSALVEKHASEKIGSEKEKGPGKRKFSLFGKKVVKDSNGPHAELCAEQILKSASPGELEKINYALLSWVEAIIEQKAHIPGKGKISAAHFLQSLRDGDKLLKFVNTLEPGAIDFPFYNDGTEEVENQKIERFAIWTAHSDILGSSKLLRAGDFRQEAGYPLVFETFWTISRTAQKYGASPLKIDGLRYTGGTLSMYEKAVNFLKKPFIRVASEFRKEMMEDAEPSVVDPKFIFLKKTRESQKNAKGSDNGGKSLSDIAAHVEDEGNNVSAGTIAEDKKEDAPLSASGSFKVVKEINKENLAGVDEKNADLDVGTDEKKEFSAATVVADSGSGKSAKGEAEKILADDFAYVAAGKTVNDEDEEIAAVAEKSAATLNPISEDSRDFL